MATMGDISIKVEVTDETKKQIVELITRGALLDLKHRLERAIAEVNALAVDAAAVDRTDLYMSVSGKSAGLRLALEMVEGALKSA